MKILLLQVILLLLNASLVYYHLTYFQLGLPFFGQPTANSTAALTPLISVGQAPVGFDFGYPEGRGWGDFDGDGNPNDFCRVVGNGGGDQTWCTLAGSIGRQGRYTGETLMKITPAGEPWGRAWVDFNGDGNIDFCRAFNGRVMCTMSAGKGKAFGNDVTSEPVADLGYREGRAWVDFNGDGKADYCRVRGSTAACLLSAGDKFGIDVVSAVLDPGFHESREWRDFNGDEKADLCLINGPQKEFLVCVFSQSDSFSKVYRDLVISP